MAAPLIERLRADGLSVGANEPYDFGVLTDHTLPVHAEGRGVPSLLIEIRNDEIRSHEGSRSGPPASPATFAPS